VPGTGDAFHRDHMPPSPEPASGKGHDPGGHRPPRLSVVLATTDAWPDLAVCLERLSPQIHAFDAELIIGDGDGRGLPEDYANASDRIHWIRRPGASVFELRALGARLASGDVIALTEDHCVMAEDWCEAVLRSHQEHPDALGIAGAIENGSTHRITDWANYLQTFGAFAAPLDPDQRERAPLLANLSLKRAALPDGDFSPGFLELQLVPELFRRRKFVADGRVVVHHVQSHGLIGTLASHFHNGRATTGLVGGRLSARQMPLRVFRSTVRTLRGKRHLRRRLITAAPLLMALSCCHALGETVGILAGPGASPARLR